MSTDPQQAALRNRLGPIRVGLRQDLTVTRQTVRGDAAYIVHDPLTFQNHAFTALEYRVLTSLRAERSVLDSFETLAEAGVLEREDEGEFLEFVLELHSQRLLQLPVSDARISFDRYERKQQSKKVHPMRALLYYRLPLWDPDPFLDRTVRVANALFSKWGFAVWAALVAFALWSCQGRLGAFLSETPRMLEIGNLPVLYIALVGLKAIHEMGHAYACKRFGGEVPEIGFAFILTAPCAYVDASASWKFTSRWQRIGVAMAGMYAESFIAAIAAVVWVGTGPGFAHDVALNVVVLATVATVLFNLNPLMRFDGYFVFADLMGVPNLQERASKEIKRRFKQWVLGLDEPVSEDQKQRRILYGLYGSSAAVYKLLLAVGIVSLVMQEWPLLGLVAGVTFAWWMLVVPAVRLFAYLWSDPEVESRRRRARTLALSAGLLIPLGLPFVPVSFQVVVPGVLESDRAVVVHAPTDGFVTGVRVREGDAVWPGEVLVEIDHPDLRLRHVRAQREEEAQQALLETVELTDPVAAAAHRARLEHLTEAREALELEVAQAAVTTSAQGRIATRMPEQLEGRFVRRGEPLVEVRSPRSLVHLILDEEQFARAGLDVGETVDLRWTASPGDAVTARIAEIRPVASRTEIPEALTLDAGEGVYTVVGEDGQSQAVRSFLHVYLEPEQLPPLAVVGTTASIRVAGRIETLGRWFSRRAAAFYQTWRMG